MGGFDETGEERMGLHGFALEFRVRLSRHVVGMILQLNELHQAPSGEVPLKTKSLASNCSR